MTKTFEIDDQLRPFLTKILEERFSAPQTLEEYESLPDGNFKLHLWIKAEILRDKTERIYKRNQKAHAKYLGRQIQRNAEKLKRLQKELREIVNFDHVCNWSTSTLKLTSTEYEDLKNHKDIAPALAIEITTNRWGR